jgi:predicted DNA-binding ribbon-helix-helix protein
METPSPYHPPVKRSLSIAGHQTSISLEPLFWDMLRAAAKAEGLAIAALVARIDAERIKSPTPPGLASAIRVWLVVNAPDAMFHVKYRNGADQAGG